MSDPSSRNLNLPFLAPAQALKHITHNEALVQLDEIVQLSVLQSDLTDPPQAPQDGDRFIIAANAGGSWTGREGEIAVWRDGSWQYQSPKTGWRAYDQTLQTMLVFDGADWSSLTTETDSAPQFGVNTSADSGNRFAIKSDAILHSHDDVTPGSGDVRHVLNKTGEAATGSFLFQSAYSGRAEIGLMGNNDLAFKVSADGVSWLTAMVINHQTGEVTFPTTPSVPTTSLPDGYDLYVDPNTGDDANDGSQALPFATLAPLRTALNSHTDVGTTLEAYVAGAVYTDQHLNLTSLAGPAEITFGEGAEIRWTLGTDQSGIQVGSGPVAELTIRGSGLIVDGFDYGTGNGLGANNNRLIAYDVNVINCADGVSGHGDAHIETYNCRFEACTKFALAHTGTTSSRHVDCYFQSDASAVGVASLLNDEVHSFENCEFDSPAAVVHGVSGGAQTVLDRCRIGSLTQPVTLSSQISVQDSFVHSVVQGNATLSFTRVFGRLSMRLRSGGALSVTDSVLDGEVDPTSSGFIYSDYDPGAYGGLNVSDSVITGYATAVSIGSASRLSYWQAASATLSDNILFGNTTNFGTHISAEIGQSITGTDTATPTIGSRGSYTMSDWAVGGGATAGFEASEAVTIGIRPSS